MTVRILHGDCREVLRTLPAESVHCCVTSPPYWGLRDYGTAKWEGGDPNCPHTATRRNHCDEKQATSAGTSRDRIQGEDCRLCGARRIDSQIGLESSITDYVAVMVEVFREVRRVLRSDGVLFLNLGDSYASGEIGRHDHKIGKRADGANCNIKEFGRDRQQAKLSTGLKAKDLCGIPWRVAFALQADGWWLRSDIIWAKPNPMPESVTDRPTKAHEYLFLLTKSPTYYYDAEAIREPHAPESLERYKHGFTRNKKSGTGFVMADAYDKVYGNELGRNRRTVWEIATSPFPEAHFATFPPALVEPCIKAGTSEKGVCGKCGAPWVREVEKTFMSDGKSAKRGSVRDTHDNRSEFGKDHGSWDVKTLGFSPSCSCKNADVVPATVLDPFGGAGTSGLVADRLGRNAVLIELNPEYAAMARKRIEGDAGLFAQVAAE